MKGARQVTAAQLDEVTRLVALMEAEGLRVCVHWNDCDCCVSVHEDVERPRQGYIVGADGSSDLYQAREP